MRMSKPNPKPRPAPEAAPPKADTNQPTPITNAIVNLNPTTPIIPQPLIADILRTKYCVPGSVFLVESIEKNIPISELLVQVPAEDGHGNGNTVRNRRDHRRRHRGPMMRAVRLLLGDGELCIQAFCRGEIHRFVDSGSVFEGGYVRLDRFDVRFGEVDVSGDGEGEGEKGVVDDGVGDPEWLEGERAQARARREKGEGRRKKERVVYLVVEDMVTVGWNEVYMGILRREKVAMEKGEGKEFVGRAEEAVIEGEQDVAQAEDFDDAEEKEVLQQLMEDDTGTAAVAVSKNPPKLQSINDLQGQPAQPRPNNDPEDPDYIPDSDSAFETLTISAERANQRRVPVTTSDPSQELQAAIIKQNQQQRQHPQPIITRPRPWLPTSATQPVKLTPLSAIPHLPYRQNWMVNVLAIVVSLSAVEPSHIAPSFRQRTARLADTSTPKQVHLTVYLDPEDFLPEVGSVVLLLGVKNHLFEGGSLRKYVSDGLVGGGRWWVQRVDELGWCQGEVRRLRAWWGAEGRERGG